MSFKARVYVAGQYTQGDTVSNVAIAIDIADKLVDKGYAPYVPHLNMFWHFQNWHKYEYWLALDEEWLAQCDAVYRILGESPGADREVVLAARLGIHVVYNFNELDTLFLSREKHNDPRS